MRRRGGGEAVELSLCRRLRPPDVACERGVHHTVAVAVRLPFVGEELRRSGVSVSSECRDGYDPAPVTPVGGGGE